MSLDLPPVPPLDVQAAADAAAVRQSLPVGALGVWGSVIDLLAAAAGSARVRSRRAARSSWCSPPTTTSPRSESLPR